MGEEEIKLKIYLSSGFTYMRHYDKEMELYKLGVRHRLFSYFYVKLRKDFTEVFNKCVEANLYDLMIDSGAHSVSTTKDPITPELYGNWLLTIKDKPSITVYVNLDVIPHYKGKIETSSGDDGREIINATTYQKMLQPKDYERSAEEGWENLVYLESLGLKPLHVFHQGEPWKWLDKLIDNYEYFGMSASRLSLGGKRHGWLDEVWKKLLDDKGSPIRKIHGFALTGPEIMVRYPWYSLDSSTWGRIGAFGNILIPQFYRNKLAYTHLSVSPESLERRSTQCKHYYRLPAAEKVVIDNWIKECGVDPAEVSNEGVGSYLKDRVNVGFFLKLEKEISRRREERKPALQKSFF